MLLLLASGRHIGGTVEVTPGSKEQARVLILIQTTPHAHDTTRTGPTRTRDINSRHATTPVGGTKQPHTTGEKCPRAGGRESGQMGGRASEVGEQAGGQAERVATAGAAKHTAPPLLLWPPAAKMSPPHPSHYSSGDKPRLPSAAGYAAAAASVAANCETVPECAVTAATRTGRHGDL